MAGQSGKRLTDSKLRNIAPNSNQLTSSSVAGLVFKPSSCTKGTGAWILRYYDKVSKKRIKITLGHYPKMGIAIAEEEAKFLRAALKQGLNPKVEKQKAQDRELQKQLNTFKSISEEFFNKEKSMQRWKNQKSIDNWSDRMKKYVYPTLADKPITEINVRDVTAILVDIWNTKTETASRVLYQIKQVFNWANVMGYCDHNPYEATKTALGKQKVLPEDERHYPAIDWRDLPTFFKDVFEGKRKSVSKYALMFVILTACRSGAARFVQWEDIDLNTKIWTLEPSRESSKATTKKSYPLSTQVLRLLKSQRNLEKLVFPHKSGEAFSDMALTAILRRHAKHFKSDIPDRPITVHGFRSAFKGWAVSMGYDDRLSEIQLCHTYGSRVQRAYDRQKMVEERREMMQAWADFCLSGLTDFESLF